MRFVILFDMLLNPTFKMTTSFLVSNLREVNLYTTKDFKSL